MVPAESGGTVWEWFQIDDFRGGTASGAMGNGVFPFSQYCTIADAQGNVYIADGDVAIFDKDGKAIRRIHMEDEFIGDGGVFKLNSGSITRTYPCSITFHDFF